MEPGDGLSHNVLAAILRNSEAKLNFDEEPSFLAPKRANSSILINSESTKDICWKSCGMKWMKVIRSGEVGVVKEMLEDKPDLAQYTPLHGPNSLHLAVAKSDRSIILLLLAKGADINLKDTAGYTCLQKSLLFFENVSLAHFLISQGASMDIRDPDGFTINDYDEDVWPREDRDSADLFSKAQNLLRPKANSLAETSPILLQNSSLKSRPASTPDATISKSSAENSNAENAETMRRGKLRGSWKSFFSSSISK
ncbi:unnamed protein product [Caenorhabditis angaria]|uniref:Uncharacterized protein n=1 Tax=Caenorhabditis angaria TaxID=860376 RepID=A0A9P1I933_9PELO|nr:unnamed protein product [Caenorhabditis angaria]